ncbi:uncharacterized protein LOC143518454 [Brachyhypopomus gauderio]|uniref:uncharacterized protein LOC143518454 n=1 Tax=Brachyhypopomus gauderio TaxID=698409 RepID=UPI004041FBA3
MSSDSNSVKTQEEDNDTNQKNEERAEKEATKGLEPENTTGNCYRPCPQNLEESNQMDLYTSLSNESEGRIDVINTGTQPGSEKQVQENNQKEQDQQLNKGELNEKHKKQKNQENVIKVEEIAQGKKEIQPMAREPNAMTGKTSVPGKDTHGTKSRPDDTQLRMAVEEQEDGDKEQKNEETKVKVDDKGVEAEEMAVRYFTILTGNTIKCHNDFLEELLKYLPCLMLESVENKSDVILIFCTQPDSERTLNTLSHITVSKPAVLVVLHDTFVPDSSISVTREKTTTVDCLFHEDQGLLDCEKNKEALSRAAKWIEDQRKRGPSPKKHIKESAIQMSRGKSICNDSDHVIMVLVLFYVFIFFCVFHFSCVQYTSLVL